MATPVADKIRWNGGMENCGQPSRSMGEDAPQFLDLNLSPKVEVDFGIDDVSYVRVVQS